MEPLAPHDLTWPGSTARVTLSTVVEDWPTMWNAEQKRASREWLAEFLASRVPNHWPQQPDSNGLMQSVSQLGSWVAEIGRIRIDGGVIVVAHTPGPLGVTGTLLAVAIARPTQFAKEAEKVLQTTGGYASDDVDPQLHERLKAECFMHGLILGRAILRRVWIPS